MKNNLHKTKELSAAQQLAVFGGLMTNIDHEALRNPAIDCTIKPRKKNILTTPNDLYVPPACSKY
jgi:hypothetical protein